MSLPPLHEEFLGVRFRCSHPKMPPHFFIITAYDPEGDESTPEEDNKIADGKLLEAIRSLGFPSFRVTGGNEDFTHAEPGFGIVCDRKEAEDLGTRFEQLAIFEVENGTVFLRPVLSPPGTDAEVGDWVDLVVLA